MIDERCFHFVTAERVRDICNVPIAAAACFLHLFVMAHSLGESSSTMFSGCFQASATYLAHKIQQLRKSVAKVTELGMFPNLSLSLMELTLYDYLVRQCLLCRWWTRLMYMQGFFQLEQLVSVRRVKGECCSHLSHFTTAFRISPTCPPELRYVTRPLCKPRHTRQFCWRKFTIQISWDTSSIQASRCHSKRTTKVNYNPSISDPLALMKEHGIPMLAMVPPCMILRRFYFSIQWQYLRV